MIGTVRAAALAVATAACAAFSTPAQATEAAPGAPLFLTHGLAPVQLSALGFNDDVGPAVSDAAEAVVDHMESILDVILPEPSLEALVAELAGAETADRQQDCLANAVYFEARGESLQGQLAVAEVVLNRAASGRYPETICEVVTQPWQFSFVRRGVIPRADRGSEAWRKAVAIARIAARRATRLLPEDVLWYHAQYVSPSWGRRLSRNTQIGLHIFYS